MDSFPPTHPQKKKTTVLKQKAFRSNFELPFACGAKCRTEREDKPPFTQVQMSMR